MRDDTAPSALAPPPTPQAPPDATTVGYVPRQPIPPRLPAIGKTGQGRRLTSKRLRQIRHALQLMEAGTLTNVAARAAGIGSGSRLRRYCLDPRPAKGVDAPALAVALRTAWERAVVAQAHSIAEQMLTISDGRAYDANRPDTMAEVGRDKLRMQARQWFVARSARAEYGDKVEHTGTVVHRAVVELPAIRDASPATLPTVTIAARIAAPDATDASVSG